MSLRMPFLLGVLTPMATIASIEPSYVKHDYIKGSFEILTNVEEFVVSSIADAEWTSRAYADMVAAEAYTNAVDHADMVAAGLASDIADVKGELDILTTNVYTKAEVDQKIDDIPPADFSTNNLELVATIQQSEIDPTVSEWAKLGLSSFYLTDLRPLLNQDYFQTVSPIATSNTISVLNYEGSESVTNLAVRVGYEDETFPYTRQTADGFESYKTIDGHTTSVAYGAEGIKVVPLNDEAFILSFPLPENNIATIATEAFVSKATNDCFSTLNHSLTEGLASKLDLSGGAVTGAVKFSVSSDSLRTINISTIGRIPASAEYQRKGIDKLGLKIQKTNNKECSLYLDDDDVMYINTVSGYVAVPNCTNGGVLATTDQIPSIDGLASLASPHFSGEPTAPSPSIGNNSTNIATTGFVQQNLSTVRATEAADVSRLYVEYEDPIIPNNRAGGYSAIRFYPTAFGATKNCIIRSVTIRSSSNAATLPTIPIYAHLCSADDETITLAVSQPVGNIAPETDYVFVFDRSPLLTYTNKYTITFNSGIESSASRVDFGVMLSVYSSEQDIYYGMQTAWRPKTTWVYSEGFEADAIETKAGNSVSWVLPVSAVGNNNANINTPIVFTTKGLSFPSGSYLSAFTVLTRESGTPYSGNILAKLTDALSSSVLAISDTIAVSALNTNYTFTFDSPPKLVSGKTYNLAFYASESATSPVNFGYRVSTEGVTSDLCFVNHPSESPIVSATAMALVTNTVKEAITVSSDEWISLTNRIATLEALLDGVESALHQINTGE